MNGNPNPETSPQQRAQYWASVQDTLAAIAADAPTYLPSDDDGDVSVLDPDAVSEIENVLLQARAVADTAAGAYSRAVRAMQQPHGAHDQRPAQQQQQQAQNPRGYTPQGVSSYGR